MCPFLILFLNTLYKYFFLKVSDLYIYIWMTHFYKEVFEKENLLFLCFVIFMFFWQINFFPCWNPGFHSVVLCKDLMNRSMHNVISTDASISHFTKKRRKRKTWIRGTVGTVSSVVGNMSKALLFYRSHIAQTVDSCTDFFRAKFCDNFLSPSNNAVGFFSFFFNTILCCDVT